MATQTGQSSQEAAETAERRVAQAYRQVFEGSPEAEIALADLLEFCSIGRTQYQPGMSALDLAYEEGKRRVALRVTSFLHLADREIARRASQTRATLGD